MQGEKSCAHSFPGSVAGMPPQQTVLLAVSAKHCNLKGRTIQQQPVEAVSGEAFLHLAQQLLPARLTPPCFGRNAQRNCVVYHTKILLSDCLSTATPLLIYSLTIWLRLYIQNLEIVL